MTKTKSSIIVWLRHDLRLADNPALHWSVAQKVPVAVVYIDDTSSHTWNRGAASKWWLHHSLTSLSGSLVKAGSRLCVFKGQSEDVLLSLISESKASTIVWNRRYEPQLKSQDTSLKAKLKEKGLEVRSFPGNVCHEPWQVQRSGKHPYRVFTAYWRASLKVDSLQITPAVRKIPANTHTFTQEVAIDRLNLLPERDWANQFSSLWSPGEAGARAQLKKLISYQLQNYQTNRDLPAVEGTSRLSPHLAFGEISPRTINAAIRKSLLQGKIQASDNTEAFLREIGWREFASHLIYHFPHTTEGPLDDRFSHFPWKRINKKILHQWQRGATGIPLVDAGMRQLWATGWMHNRVRMVVGSLLIKNLGYHWLEGARWFWDTLVDADLASNTMGWQWVAGTGADAAPYFRIFNPVRQAERFDPEGIYVRRWVPEIAKLNNKRIHCPWTATDAELAEAGIVPGKTYPKPVIDLITSRQEALLRFDRMKSANQRNNSE